jgi:large subunit ribosomal protein L29
MEIDDIRALADGELETELVEARRELMNLRFRVATMQLSNVTEIRKVKRRVARIMTITRERELARAAL